MDQENVKQAEAPAEPAAVDPWEAAFAALDKEKEEADQGDADTGGGDAGDVQDPTAADAGDGSADVSAEDDGPVPDVDGGAGSAGGTYSEPDAGAAGSLFNFTEEQAEEYKESLKRRIQEQTVNDVAAAFVKQGWRNVNGRLGASIDDPDIRKRDEDGITRYYNPETGREFTSEDPLGQAMAWIDRHNMMLRDAFNRTCSDYAKKLLDEQGAGLSAIDFAPKYRKLDPVRKAMLDSILEDYEVKDESGKLIGYSCDLDKALNAVNRQVKVMQDRFKNTEPASKEPTGPALDMKSTGSNKDDDEKREFKSIAEAMEYQQDRLLEKMKKGK